MPTNKTKKQTQNKNTNKSTHLFGSVAVGTKGQLVIPVEARKQYNINPGDQLLVFGNSNGQVLALIKSDQISELLNDLSEIIS